MVKILSLGSNLTFKVQLEGQVWKGFVRDINISKLCNKISPLCLDMTFCYVLVDNSN